MKKEHEEAEGLVKNAIEDLQKKIDKRDGEDISCYAPSAFDNAIMNLIHARSLMSAAEKVVI